MTTAAVQRAPLVNSLSVAQDGPTANPQERSVRQHYFDEPLYIESAATLDAHPLLWDWPFAHNGVARCKVTPLQFSVELDFSYLKNMKHRDEIKKFDGLKNNAFMWQIGLSPTPAVTADDPTAPLDHGSNQFWRLEMYVIETLNMLCIEACRQIGTSKCCHSGMSMRDMRKLRRVFKLPAEYDIGTLSIQVTRQGSFLLKADRRADPEDPIGPNRRAVRPSGKLKRSETFR